MRCLVKCIALHGLGLYIYEGEDIPVSEQPTPQSEPPAAQLLQAFMVGVRKLVTDAEFNKATQLEKNTAFLTWKTAENKEEAIYNAVTTLAKHYKWNIKNA